MNDTFLMVRVVWRNLLQIKWNTTEPHLKFIELRCNVGQWGRARARSDVAAPGMRWIIEFSVRKI